LHKIFPLLVDLRHYQLRWPFAFYIG
jgi:hypothetical protein